MMIAQVCGYKPGEFVHTFGDAHLYLNHLQQAELQLSRDPFPLPQMKLNRSVDNLFEFQFQDFELVNYQYHPKIAAPIAV
jgi:thymidylate synthase